MRVQAPRDASHNHAAHQPATDKQRRFARQLVAERGGDVTQLLTGYALDRGTELIGEAFVTRYDASSVIDALLRTPRTPASGKALAATKFAGGATEAQQRLVEKLLGEKDLTGTAYEGWTPDWDRATKQAASAVIDYLFTLPKRAAERAATAAVDPEAGVYRFPGDHLVRVYFGQVSGRMLAKPVIETTEKCYCSDLQGVPCRVCKGEVTRTYALGEPKLAVRLFETIGGEPVKLSLEEAKEWGRTTGHCVACGRKLDVPESVDAGIGPKCARNLA